MKKNIGIGIIFIIAFLIIALNIQQNYGTILLSVIFVIMGLFMLIVGGNYLVDGSSSLALKYSIPPIVIGLTIVSFGTSAPELVVSILSAINKNADLSISNVVGSNMVNLLLILGISTIIYKIKVNKSTLHYEIPFSIASTFILFVIINDKLFGGIGENILTRGDGIVLLSLFGFFMYYIYRLLKIGNIQEEIESIQSYGLGKSLFFVILGILGLYIGGRLTVDGSIFIAKNFGVSEMLIGATIVGVGTSLPELVASVIAAIKKNADIAIGNVIGSNIFNIVWILGLSGSIININYNNKLNFDILLLLICSILLIFYAKFSKGHYLDKKIGFIFLGIYLFYIGAIIIRG